MKKYINPMLQIVSINKNDIIATSERSIGFNNETTEAWGDAADRFRGFDEY